MQTVLENDPAVAPPKRQPVFGRVVYDEEFDHMLSWVARIIALFGAGGKMGCRVIDHLKDNPDYSVLCVETGERGLDRLTERGLSPVSQTEALAAANVVILALPDRVLGQIAREIVPRLKSGTMVFTLDPAAVHAAVPP